VELQKLLVEKKWWSLF